MRRTAGTSWLGLLLGVVGSLALVGCGGGDDVIEGPPDTATDHFYVANTLAVPTTAAQATMYGLDLDGDPQQRPDNQLGNILSTLAQQDVNVQEQIDEAISMGEVVILSRVLADFAIGGGAEWQIYLGNEANPPDFTGQGAFTVSADSPDDALLDGVIAGGQFSGGPATVGIEIALVEGGDPLRLNLIGSKIVGSVADGSCDAKLGGAITKNELDTVIIPTIADMMNNEILNDAGCQMTPPMCDSNSQTVLDLFDANDDMMITTMEIQENSLIKSLLAPDVDLLDAAGNYAPRSDGVDDSLSLGVKFTCVGAVFTP